MADRERELRRVWQEEIFRRELWAVYHSDMQRNARVRAVVAYVANAVAEGRSILEGTETRRRPPGHRR
jgi:DNA-binding transcriptional LysR family regulator